ncbi:MAG: Mov34/MPN/PAD-1 family protein [Anaerolineae bacterium]|nr:Mov34/MPN/PAD-1 family protein [Anaerolineae bacterium]MCO5204865.1 Mov34/MPN/PAD-1 family protein [Anaerolineae bacterium]
MTVDSITTPEAPYVVALRLTPPEMQGRLTVTITLQTADQVGSGVHAKPLRDCTLAELQQYADALEQSFWEAHENSTLQALLDDESIAVDIVLDDGEPQDTALTEALLLARVIISEDDDSDDSEQPTAEMVEAQHDPVTDESVADVAIEPDSNEVSSAEESSTPTVLPEPIVTIVESAEAAPSETAKPDKPQTKAYFGRIAGGVRPNDIAQNDAVDILLEEKPLRAMQTHAVSSMRREVAGVMFGPQPEKQPNGRYVVRVIDSVIAQHTRMSGASVTYTPESWRYVNDQLNTMYPDGDVVIVGWYHTHPGFGIFLSGMDLFIHENFFTQSWHIAYVLDPVARRSGFFCWDRSQKRVKEYDLPWPEWAKHSW